MPEASRETVEARDDERVTGFERVERFSKAGSLSHGSADAFVGEDDVAARELQRVDLRVDSLLVRAHTRVANEFCPRLLSRIKDR